MTPEEKEALEYILDSDISRFAPDMGGRDQLNILKSKRILHDLLHPTKVKIRTIIAGSRTLGLGTHKYFKDQFDEMLMIFDHCNTCPWFDSIDVTLSGKAKGVDLTGELWSKAKGLQVIPYWPDWKRYELAAGPIRNREMAKNADGLILFWDGREGSGSENMLKLANEYNLLLHVKKV